MSLRESAKPDPADVLVSVDRGSHASDEDTGLFGPDSVTWRVHVEQIMWVAGLRALYLQSLHPRVMRGTYQNSALFDRGKAWDRFLRTAEFVTVRTYGAEDEVERAGARVRHLHARLRGHDPDTGETYRLDEPDSLRWVHCCEIDSYVDVARRSGVLVDDAEADAYVAEARQAAGVVGLDPKTVPASRAELAAYFENLRPTLRITSEAARGLFNSFHPPLPSKLAVLRPAVPAANLLALSSLPGWARHMFGVPALPGAETVTTWQLRAARTAVKTLRPMPVEVLIGRARLFASEIAARRDTPA